MFRFGSGKVATVYRHLADLSRRTLADDDDRLVADFASCYGFADPEWELPEYIAQRDELLASWRETYGFRTGFMNPWAALRNQMNEANFILQWEHEHFGRCLRTRERKAAETILASIEHFHGQLGLSKTGMVAALQAMLSNKAAPACEENAEWLDSN
jgi:hypothetical protein